MAIGTIDGASCQIVNINSPTGKRQRVVTWIVAGLTGIGAHKVGLNDGEWTCELIYFGIKADCDAFAVAVDAMQAKIVIIVDSKGDTYSGMLVESVANRQTVRALHATNLAGAGLGVQGWKYTTSLKGKTT